MSKPFDADIAVVGVGSMGSMALWQAAEMGQSVIGFEQFDIGHDRSAGGGESRQFRSKYLEKEVLEAMALAEPLYRKLEQQTGLDILRITGGLSIGPADGPLISIMRERILAAGDQLDFMTVDQAHARFPQHRLRSDEAAIFDPGTGYIRPEVAIVGAAMQARKLGAPIESRSTVTEIEQLEEGVRIRANNRDWYFRKVVVTSGPWTWKLLPGLPGFTHLRRIVMPWYVASKPDLFKADVFPTWTREKPGHEPFFGISSIDGALVKVASVVTYGDFNDADALDYSVTATELDEINGLVDECLPDLVPFAVRQQVYMDGFTQDQQPVVGSVPGSQDVLVAAGFSGRGFKMTPVIGRILAQLAAGHDTGLDLSHWAPTRFVQ